MDKGKRGADTISRDEGALLLAHSRDSPLPPPPGDPTACGPASFSRQRGPVDASAGADFQPVPILKKLVHGRNTSARKSSHHLNLSSGLLSVYMKIRSWPLLKGYETSRLLTGPWTCDWLSGGGSGCMTHVLCVQAIRCPSFHMVSSFVASVCLLPSAHAQFHPTRSLSRFFCALSQAPTVIMAEVFVVFVQLLQQLHPTVTTGQRTLAHVLSHVLCSQL